VWRKIHRRLIAVIVVLSIVWLPTGMVSADIGPKPTLEFHFSYPNGQSLSAVSGALLDCSDDACLDTGSLKENPSTITCQSDSCSGMMFYRGSHTKRLQVLFSDNQTRLSNPFTVDEMGNVYVVEVQNAALFVQRDVIRSNNSSLGLSLCIIPYTAAGILMLAIGLLSSNLFIESRNRTNQLPFKVVPGRYILAWVLAALALVGGTILTWALPLTILIELGVAYLYIRYIWPVIGTWGERYGDTVIFHKHNEENRPPWLPLLTAVVSVNLITQPLLWAIASSLTGDFASAFSWPVIVLEIAVWIIESVLLRITQWRQFKWGDAAFLSFLMNLTSFAIGLLINL
jgi:hypothetical protein